MQNNNNIKCAKSGQVVTIGRLKGKIKNGDKVYKTVIPRNVKLSEAPSYGLPISLYDAKSKGARAYEKLAREVLKNNETKNNKEE